MKANKRNIKYVCGIWKTIALLADLKPGKNKGVTEQGFKGADGTVHYGEDGVAVLGKHFSNLGNPIHEKEKLFNKKFKKEVEAKLKKYRAKTWTEEIEHRLDKRITKNEMRLAIKRLKKGKAAGTDNLVGDIYKYTGEKGVTLLFNLCQLYFILEVIPEE